MVGTSTNDARRARLKEFGADLAVNTKDADWPEQVLKATGGKGVNLTVDMLSGPVVSQTMQATALLGRIVNIGRLAGMKAEFDFDAACAEAHRLHRRHLPHPHGRGGARNPDQDARRPVGRGQGRQASRCRSTRPIRSPRRRPGTSTCAPTSTSARFC